MCIIYLCSFRRLSSSNQFPQVGCEPRPYARLQAVQSVNEGDKTDCTFIVNFNPFLLELKIGGKLGLVH